MMFLCYPKCSTCQKAKAWLEAHAVSFTPRDIQLERPSAEELRAWIRESGQPVRKFFNTSGMAYRALSLKDRLPTMDEAAQIELLASDGMLVKRPLLISDGKVLIGFRPSEWEAALLDGTADPFH